MSTATRPLQLDYTYQEWRMRKVFRIARGAKTWTPVHVVHVSDGEHVGRGECGELRHYGETKDSIVATFEAMHRRLDECATPALLNAAFPAGSARNAVDCALWDLACKRSGQSIWQLTGIAPQPRLEIDCSIGIDAAPEMCRSAQALAAAGYREIKIKVDAGRVLQTVSAIARAAPGVRLIVDANEAWSLAQLKEVAAPLRELNVVMIEQPLHRSDDHELEGFDSPVPLYADESCATSGDLERLAQRYDGINIKLDKCGGLTEALQMARGARERRLGVMIGCNGATSLGLAPAYVVGTLCDFRDLDSAALHLDDRSAAMRYERGEIWCFTPQLWG
jgi:L-Ala-D/L-Glu epimerase